MTIGIIGGGQLGLMMAEAAKLLNHEVISLDPNPNCPLAKISDKHITASYNDSEAMKQLNDLSDVITYEFENVDWSKADDYSNKFLYNKNFTNLQLRNIQKKFIQKYQSKLAWHHTVK